MEWRDTTNYDKHDTVRTPTCWSINSGDLKVTVLNDHRAKPGLWVMHGWRVGIDTHVLGKISDLTEAEAKAKAIRIVKARAKTIASEAEGLA